MKINVEFDLTPAEFRQSLGLPDVETFQRDLMSRIQQQMEAGVEGYDPWSLMQLFSQPGAQQGVPQGMQQSLSQGMANFGNYQQMMMDMLRQASSTTSSSKQKADSSDTDESTSSKAGASAKSRQNRKS